MECPDHCDDSFSCVIRGPSNVLVTEPECEVKSLSIEKKILYHLMFRWGRIVKETKMRTAHA